MENQANIPTVDSSSAVLSETKDSDIKLELTRDEIRTWNELEEEWDRMIEELRVARVSFLQTLDPEDKLLEPSLNETVIHQASGRTVRLPAAPDEVLIRSVTPSGVTPRDPGESRRGRRNGGRGRQQRR